jgi:hypothetical protein
MVSKKMAQEGSKVKERVQDEEVIEVIDWGSEEWNVKVHGQ